ncbi:fibronectin type III domain-containing protein [Kitasatospora sp. NPDC015120]|uniref:fibronectin type III domain-containing protein n=1 Tax=Kitasatospora sp. NPDC015120 TaxID=3364023 RepID=UPI0036F497D3
MARDGAVDVDFVGGRGSPKGYVVTAAPGGSSTTVAADARTARLTGLANGTIYRLTVRQQNTSGGDSTSAASDPVQPGPAVAPTAPVLEHVLGRQGSAEVLWGPADDGGSPLTRYVVTAEPGGHRVEAGADTGEATLTGLSDGQEYTVSVRAENKAGAGEAATGKVTPGPARAPGAPADVSVAPSATGGPGLDITWTPPLDDGGSALTGYTVTVDDRALETSDTSLHVGTLTPGHAYAVTVTAHNAAGAGPAAKAAAPVEPDVTVDRKTVVLSPQSLAGMSNATEDTVTFDDPTEQVRGLQAGQIIVGAATTKVPGGVLRTVAGVEDDGSSFVVRTTDATLEQAIDDGEASFAGALERDRVRSVRSLHSGARVTLDGRGRRPRAIGGGADWDFGITMTPNPEDPTRTLTVASALRGEISLEPHWSASLDFSLSKGVTAEFRATADIRASLDAKLSAYFTTSFVNEQLATVEMDPITFHLGPVPVVITPELSLSLQLNGSGGLEVAFTGHYHQVVGGAVRYNAGFHSENLTGPAESDFHTSFSPSVSVAVELPARITLYFYGAAGPSVAAVPSVTFRAAPAENPWATVDLGGRIELGFHVKALDLYWSTTLTSLSHRLWDSGGPYDGLSLEPAVKLVQVGSRTRLSAHREGCTSDGPLTWSMAPGSQGTISTDGVYTAPDRAPVTDTVIAVQAATATCPEKQASAELHVGPRKPGGVRNASATRDGDLFTLHWDPPTDDGGQTPRYAVVYRGDFLGHHEFVTRVVDTTEVTFDKASLYAFGNTTFQVVPINSYGAGPLCPPVTVPDPA